MYKKTLVLSLALLVLLLSLYGCGIKNAMPVKEMPPLKNCSRIAVIFFNGYSSEKYNNLPILLSYTTGTNLSIKCKDKEWLFDKSERYCAMSDRLEMLNIKPSDIYQDPDLAKKLSQSLEVDLIIIGRVEKPRFTQEMSGKVDYVMSDVDVTGAARYYTVHQTALLKADFKIFDSKANQVIWDGRIMGYKKYDTRYRTGSSPISQREEVMLNDVKMDLIQRFIEILYPAMTGPTV